MFTFHFKSTVFCCLLTLGLFPGCSKDKLKDITLDNVSLTNANSAIRLFNFTNTSVDISINNIPLTNYTSGQATTFGLKLFPSGVWTNSDGGSPFFIPTSLVDKQNKVHLLINPSGSVTNYIYPNIDTVLQIDPANPKDYYVLSNGTMKVINRSIAMPSQPDHFKIRIVNLASDSEGTGILYGPMTLTYANGQPVSPVTSGIDTGHTSGYVELPLGAYEFKVFVNGDFTKQLPELPLQPNFNGWNQTKAGQPQQQEAMFPKIRTFKAGGTYSIVITKTTAVQLYRDCCNTWTWYEPVNSYRIVTEQSAATNTTYACMDAVNALRNSVVSLSVDGTVLGSNIGFGKSVDHGVFVFGTHHVKAVDQKGQTVAEKDITMYANDYLTAWVYLNPAGSPDIVFSSTDMTSTLYLSDIISGTGNSATVGTDYGTNGSLRISTRDYCWHARFLNLSEDVPYMTIGHDSSSPDALQNAGYDLMFLDNTNNYHLIYDSTNFPSATVNLTRGFTGATEPYLMYQINGNDFWQLGFGTSGGNPNIAYYFPGVMKGSNKIIAFNSNPGPPPVIPGTYIGNIRGLYWRDFIANPAMYTTPYFQPLTEPGYYSVALVGKVSDPVSGQPQLIYIKHNK